MDKENLCREFIALQINKSITRLFKSQLDNLEDIKSENENILSKASLKTSSEFASSINSLGEDKFEQMRKRILDAGNDSIREVTAMLDIFNYEVNEKKLEEYVRSKRVIKRKFCFGGGYVEEEQGQGI